MTLGLQIGYCTDSKKTFSMGKEENIKGFWADLASRKRPFFVLAPMADVTDVAFRQIISKYGNSFSSKSILFIFLSRWLFTSF